MINIEIPEFDITFKNGEHKKVPENKSGVYILYTVDNKPLYVGKSTDLRVRLYSHFKGLTNTSSYKESFDNCKLFFEDDPLNMSIYELFLINTLNPPVNLVLKHSNLFKMPSDLKRSPNFKETHKCNFIKKDGNKCGGYAHENGYCHVHGGNGITKGSRIKEFLESTSN